ncbi:hypothetical protein C3B79_2478 [Aeromonas hydrophila]|nr:hypothetical protein C3B79_2478 [Aeromonas hydrophila]
MSELDGVGQLVAAPSPLRIRSPGCNKTPALARTTVPSS